MATDYSTARRARDGNRDFLLQALPQARARTLQLLAVYVDALGPALRVPYSTELNPPLWEVGHIGWFWDFWIARNQQRHLGLACDPAHTRPEGRLTSADFLYNSSQVAHASRWSLALPDLAATRDYLAASLDDAMAQLSATAPADDLYFFQLSLFHEDMHAEAAVYMAQALGIALPEALTQVPATLPVAAPLTLPATAWTLGSDSTGFVFDNELQAQNTALSCFSIDSVPVSWRRFLPGVECGAVDVPRYVRRHNDLWQVMRGGRWEALDLASAAVHLSWSQASAWCRWAGRRLPTEAEWEYAAMTSAEFSWGEVWEWTASRFAPFPGFVAHPYRDYSVPAFAELRYVLKGASLATHPRMAHPKYRNYFTPQRADIHTGFRSCAL